MQSPLPSKCLTLLHRLFQLLLLINGSFCRIYKQNQQLVKTDRIINLGCPVSNGTSITHHYTSGLEKTIESGTERL